MVLVIHKKKATPLSYGSKRSLSAIRYIIFHYTGNKGDTAKNNASYFASGNTRQAGAHFFVDRAGVIYESIPMKLTAYAVGGFYTKEKGAGSLYQKATNSNSVSIELCDLVSGKPSPKQMAAAKKLVRRIQKKCPHAKTIIRHWDVNGKACPATMMGTENKSWKHFLNYLKR